MLTRMLFAVPVALAMVACGDPAAELAPETEPAETVESDREPEPTEEPEPDPEPTEDESAAEVDDGGDTEHGRHVARFDVPVIWSHHAGLEIRVHGLSISSHAWLREQEPDVDELVDERVQTWLALEVEAVNSTGETIAWYPDQGELFVLDEQREADLWFSGDVGHTDWQDGARRQDQIVFGLHSAWDDVVAAGDARLLVRSPSRSDDFEPIGGDADVTISW